MAAWARLAAPVALALAAAPAAALQGGPQPELAYAQITSAAQDCLDSYKGFAIDPKQLKQRGWKKAKLEGFGNLRGVMTGFVRGDGMVMLSTRYSCIVKARLEPPASAASLAAAISGKWSVQPMTAADGRLTWLLPERRIELTPGPADGSNVSLAVAMQLEGVE